MHLARRVPEDSSAFRSFFRAPIRFNQELTALVFPVRHLGLKVSTADPQLRLALQRAVRELEAIARADLVDELKRSLRERLATSDCSCEEASRRLSVHRRTMNRRLKAAGTSFRTVLDELRFEVARQLVSDTELPLAQISAALNFSEPAAFTPGVPALVREYFATEVEALGPRGSLDSFECARAASKCPGRSRLRECLSGGFPVLATNCELG